MLARAIRVAAVEATLNFSYSREQIGQGADRCGLTGAAVTHDDHAPDIWIDRTQQQRELHFLLTDDRGKWIDNPSIRRRGCRIDALSYFLCFEFFGHLVR